MRIYGICDLDRDKIVYVGRTINENDFTPHGKHISKLVKRYPTRYQYIIVEENITNEQILNTKEMYYIDKFNTFNDLTCYNFTKGGSGGFTLAKATKEERHKIKQKELSTKRNNPEIMKNASKKARETFLQRPKSEQNAIIKSRFNKSLIAKQQKKNQLTPDEKRQRTERHSNQVKRIHQQRSSAKQCEINNKIKNTLRKDLITLQHLDTKEILSLYSTEWQRKYKVHTWHLINKKQNHCHRWALLS